MWTEHIASYRKPGVDPMLAGFYTSSRKSNTRGSRVLPQASKSKRQNKIRWIRECWPGPEHGLRGKPGARRLPGLSSVR
jgi:hypothetical protein